MLQAIVKVIGYCTAVSGYLDIYIKILQEHIIPIITEIKDEVPLDEKNIPVSFCLNYYNNEINYRRKCQD